MSAKLRCDHGFAPEMFRELLRGRFLSAIVDPRFPLSCLLSSQRTHRLLNDSPRALI